MKILVACDSFKGSMSSIQAMNAIVQGIHRANEKVEVISFPVADGGEGTVDAFLSACGGRKETLSVHGPNMEEIETYYGVLDNQTVIMEMASASGLTLVKEENRNPLKTTTFGTGEMIRDALEKGYKKIIIGLGGSATNDGGAGMAQALGVQFYDEQGQNIPDGIAGGDLIKIHWISKENIDPRINDTEIILASDVTNPLLGIDGATAIFGPQKGADETMLQLLEKGMKKYASLLNEEVQNQEGSGAAGGLGAGLLYFCHAKIVSGIDLLLNQIPFKDLLKDTDLVITGEGQIDGQSKKGKVPVGIARHVKQIKDVPVIAFVGSIGEGAYQTYEDGIDGIFSIVPGIVSLQDSMEHGEEYLSNLSESIMKVLTFFKV